MCPAFAAVHRHMCILSHMLLGDPPECPTRVSRVWHQSVPQESSTTVSYKCHSNACVHSGSWVPSSFCFFVETFYHPCLLHVIFHKGAFTADAWNSLVMFANNCDGFVRGLELHVIPRKPTRYLKSVFVCHGSMFGVNISFTVCFADKGLF